MTWGPLVINLAVTLGAVAFLMLATFAYAMRTGVQAIMDSVWSFGFVVIAGVTFALSQGHGDPTIRRVLRYVYYAQGRMMWIVSIPVQFAMYETHPVRAVIWIGVAVWLIGFGFESIGDWQLRRFKSDPTHAGKIMDRGLWRYTRHPNYFGDSVVWVGLFLVASANWFGLITLISPIIMTNLLVNHTGKALLEKHMGRSKGEEYATYVSRTSGFFPLPPKP
jgi:steroid 5-alpha reductase family enzyme